MTILNEDDKEITGVELSFKRSFLTKISYNYGAIKNQRTNLVVNVADDAIEQPIIKEINSIEYSLTIFSDITVDELRAKITPEFIKQQLSKENQSIFRDDKFKLNKITKDGRELEIEDLKKAGMIKTQINYNYGSISNQNTNLIIDISLSETDKKEIKIIEAINKITYNKIIEINSESDDLKKSIDAEFIKNELPSEVEADFDDSLFWLNKISDSQGRELENSDLQKAGEINVKINYDYGGQKKQNTNLKVTIQDHRILLEDVFKDFKFVDSKGVFDFLDTYDLKEISKQIIAKLNISSLDEVGLILENLTTTSVLLKAKNNSKIYFGEVELTWKLKLFEVYGSKELIGNEWIKEGLKGYFYLESDANEIKYFDLMLDSNLFNYQYNDYHSFQFNTVSKEWIFLFNGKWEADSIPSRFGSFDLDNYYCRINADSPELENIKFFNQISHQWEGLIYSSEFLLDRYQFAKRN